ncbi:phosphohydrolase [Pontibacillus halophilus JSM 076056 = DSM 19796]|uniref:Phosphohydrolase n=1 Tax=Pontibacillus halophilus JSM 076056 = DSM 19796 TaxID=1385510 RepID=A0A0A5GKC8_9BACI|nr:HD domain-containing protein [Pontibacillus halophilus]KGX91610.1 phosphohydrolase [Pontibacillus halophilus JSM 076056 = DSM 19796]
MREVTLVDIFKHHITRKYLFRSGVHHAVTVAEHALALAKEEQVNLDLATKAALLHDIGHYEWYVDGEWDYDEYRKNDIHAIKGAERAHKLLIRLGEDRTVAKEVSVAILLHTDSYLPFTVDEKTTPLQKVVKRADEMDELPKGLHHYKEMDFGAAIKRLHVLDLEIDAYNDVSQREMV